MYIWGGNMIKTRRLLYPLLFSLIGLITLFMITGLQVKADDSKVSISVQDAVLTADTNAYVVDQTTKSKISNNTSIMDSQAQSYVDTDSVNPGDKLEFNYMFVFNSGEATANMQATIALPKNVTFSTGTIGKIVYTSSDGKKTTTTDISDSAVDSDNNLTTSIDDLGTGKDYASARIVLNATAGDAGQTVEKSQISYEADNYDNVDNTPEFDIKDPANSIVAATDSSSLQTYDGDTFNLTGTMDYKNDDGIAFKNENMYIYTNIDGVDQLPVQDTASSDKNFSLIMQPLAIGNHTITVQIVQKNYNSTGETIVSNILTYNVEVSANSLIITKDKSFDGDGYTVNDDDPVNIKGTYKHADGSEAHGTTSGLTLDYQITSRADTDDPNVQDSQSATYNDNGTFNFAVDPVVYKMMGGRSPLIEQAFTYDQYIAKHGYKGLEVGKNIVTVTLKDQNGHVSDPTQFVINVPDVQLNLSLGANDIGSYNPNASLGGTYNIPISLSYSDTNYQFSEESVAALNTLNNVEARSNFAAGDDLVNRLNGDQSIAMENSGKSYYGFSSPDNLVISDKAYPASIYYVDTYGRKSNTVDYNVTFRSKYVEIKTEDNYKFKSFKNADSEAPMRDGDWNVKVESYKSSWTLRASATPFYQYFTDGRKPVELGGHLFYNTPYDDGQSASLPMENQQVVIDKYTANLNSDHVITTDVASKWDNNTGILLSVRGPSNSYAGTYTSTISWEATDSI